MPWWMDKKPEEKKIEEKKDAFEMPKEVKEKFDKIDQIDSIKTDVAAFKEKTGILDRMASFMDAEDAKKTAEGKKKQQENKQQTDAELEEEFLTDPAAATRKLLQGTMNPLIVAQINTGAKLTIKEMYEDDPEGMQYLADPKVKEEVEKLVSTLPLDQRANKESIRNCYYVAEGKFKQEIKDGKIKSKLSSISSSGTGTGAPKDKTVEVIHLTDEQKRAAKVFGIKEEDYAKSAKELNYV